MVFCCLDFGLLVWFDCVGALVIAQVVGWWVWVWCDAILTVWSFAVLVWW